MSKTIQCLLFFSYLLSEVFPNDKYLSFSLWVNTEEAQSSLHFTFGQNIFKENYSRLYLDLLSNVSLVEEGPFYNITSINPNQGQYRKFEATGSLLLQDTIYNCDRTDVNVTSFFFELVKSSPKQKTFPEGRLCLSRSPDSFLNQLIRQGKVTKPIISLAPWEIRLGDQLNRAWILHKAPLIDHYNHWATHMSSLLIGMIEPLNATAAINHLNKTQYKSIDINLPLVLDTENVNIIFPYAYAEVFSKVVLSKQLEKGKCEMNEKGGEITFECDGGVFYNTNLYFMLDGVLIELKRGELHWSTRTGSKREYQLPITFKKYINSVLLGRRYIKKFNLVLNEEDGTMGFPHSIPSYLIDCDSKGGSVINEGLSFNQLRFVYAIAIVLLMLGIILGLYFKKILIVKSY